MNSDYVCKDPVCGEGPIPRHWGLGLQHLCFPAGHHPTRNRGHFPQRGPPSLSPAQFLGRKHVDSGLPEERAHNRVNCHNTRSAINLPREQRANALIAHNWTETTPSAERCNRALLFMLLFKLAKMSKLTSASPHPAQRGAMGGPRGWGTEGGAPWSDPVRAKHLGLTFGTRCK